ncbi:hypothetical protein [Corynebacterium aurimucosum]|uniref:hypothetical protein n=1 Tax=Corynebacterium aurimucosum TaxID=169292 RepID=UPI0039B6F447
MTTSLSRRAFRRPTALLFAATLGAAALSACSSGDDSAAGGSDAGSDKETIHVVASTSIWADVAQAVVDTAQTDVNIDVRPIVSGNGVDPITSSPPRPTSRALTTPTSSSPVAAATTHGSTRQSRTRMRSSTPCR